MSKPHLTEEQALRAAVAVLLDGVDNHVIANLFGVNQGRVSEDVQALKWALQNRKTAYKLATGKWIAIEHPGE